MKTTRTPVRLGIIAMMVALLSTFFAGLAHAAGPNNLTLHINADHPAPYAYAAWRLTDTTTDTDTLLAQLAPLSDAQVTALADGPAIGSTPVNDLGDAQLTGLADGRYYVRAATPDHTSITTIVAPLIVDLPQVAADGTVTRNVTVFPKTVEPPPPPPTGGECFMKVNPQGKGLQGATFNVMTRGADGNYTRLLVDGQPLVVTSEADGRFKVLGVPYGTYYLVEAQAPTGYQLVSSPIEFKVDATTYDDPVVIQIVNTALPPGKIPKTGDLSLLLSLATGVILIGMGAYLTRKPGRSTKG